MKIIRKILIFVIFIMIVISIKREDIKIYGINIENNVLIPHINIKEIDDFIELKVNELIKDYKNSYNNCKVEINYDYHINKKYLNYKFNIYVLYDYKILYNIKTYNFNLTNYKPIYLSNEYIISECLETINKKSSIMIHDYDVYLLKYLIKDNEIVFLIPLILTNDKIIEIKVSNIKLKYDYFKYNNPLLKVALTFDDGPSAKTKELVDILVKLKIPATFFILGINALNYPENLKYIYDNGFQIGNHGFSHELFTLLSKDNIMNEIHETNKIIYSTIKYYPYIVRVPYGAYNDDVLKTLDYPMILWNSDSEDWKKDGKSKVDNVLINIRNETIILFHDFNNFAEDAIIELVMILKDQGYRFCYVTEILKFNSEENIIRNKVYL